MNYRGGMRSYAVIKIAALLLVIAGGVFLFSNCLHAEIPFYLGYQGRLKDISGNPLTGSHNFIFRIYASSTGGAALWTETQTVTADNGFFAVNLGTVSTLILPFDREYWLSVEVSGDGEMSPRARINSVGYSYTTAGVQSSSTAPTVFWGGSMYYDTTSGTIRYYDAVGTTWRTLFSGTVSGGGTLDDAYDFGGAGAGRSITVDSGAVYLSGAGNGTALRVDYSGTGQAMHIEHSGTGEAFSVRNSSTGTGFYSRNVSTGNGLRIDNGSTGRGIYLDNSSTGVGMRVDNTAGGFGFDINNANGTGLSITNTGAGDGIYVRTNNGIGIDVSNDSATYGLLMNNNGTGIGLGLNNVSGNWGLDINNTNGDGMRISQSSAGMAMYIRQNSGSGIVLDNNTGNSGIMLTNNSSGNGIRIDNQGGGNGLYVWDTGSKAAIYLDVQATSDKALYIEQDGTGPSIDVIHNGNANSVNVSNRGTGLSLRVDDQSGDTTPFVITDRGDTGIGLVAPSTKLHINTSAANTTPIFTLQNTGGDFQVFRTDATPEGAVTGSVGDLAVDSTGGDIFIKKSGAATNTGWLEMATLSDITGSLLWSDQGTYIYPTESGSSTMVIHDGGSVSIGTSASGSSLTVSTSIGIAPFYPATFPSAIRVMDTNVTGGTDLPTAVIAEVQPASGYSLGFGVIGNDYSVDFASSKIELKNANVNISGDTITFGVDLSTLDIGYPDADFIVLHGSSADDGLYQVINISGASNNIARVRTWSGGVPAFPAEAAQADYVHNKVNVGNGISGRSLEVAGGLQTGGALAYINQGGLGNAMEVRIKNASSTNAVIHIHNSGSGADIDTNSGQWAIGNTGDAFFLPTTMGFGIGTSSPSATLDIQGAGLGSYYGYATLANFEVQNEGTWSMVFNNMADGSNTTFGFWQKNNGDLVLASYDGANTYDPFMSWDHVTGNVGIGIVSASATFDVGGDIQARDQGDLRMADADSSNYIAFQSPAALTGNYTYTWPSAYGTGGQALITDGSGGLSWQTVSGSGAFAQDFDSVYDASVSNTNLVMEIDNGTLEFELSGANNLNLDMQGTGDIIIMDGGAAYLTLADDDSITYVTDLVTVDAVSLTGNSLTSGDLLQLTADNLTTGYALNIVSGSILIDAGDAIFDQDVVIGGSTSRTETLDNAGFVMGGDDLFIGGMMGVEGSIYSDGSFIAGTTLELNDAYIRDSGNLVLQSDADTDDYIYLDTTGNEEYLYFEDASLAYGNDPGLRLNSTSGELEYRDENEAGWTSFDSLSGGGGYWSRTGTDLSPATAGDDILLNAGETLTISDIKGGSVLFASSSGMIMEDNANLYWDDTNDRFGIGTSAPETIFQVERSDTGYSPMATESMLMGIFESNNHGYLQFLNPNTASTGLLFGDDTYNIGGIFYTHSLDMMQFRVSGNVRLNIASTGYAAFGKSTTAADAQIEVGDATADYIDGANDVLIADDLEVDGTIALAAGGLLIDDAYIRDSGNLVLQSDADTDDYIYLDTTGNEEYLYFEDASLAYGNDPGLRLNSTTGELEYRDENEAGWTSFDSMGGGGGAQDFDDVYDQSVTNVNLTMEIDNGTLEFESSATNDFIIDLQGTGDFRLQDAGTDFLKFNDDDSVNYTTDLTTANAWQLTGNSLTTGDLLQLSATALTTGDALQITTNGTLTGYAINVVSGGILIDAGDAIFDANIVVGGSTSRTETMDNAEFVMGGDDLFVAGMAGVEGNVYTDGKFVSKASTEFGDSTTQGFVSSSHQIALMPNYDSDDYLYVSTASDMPGFYWEGATGNDPGFRVNNATGELEYRDENESAWTSLDSLGGGGGVPNYYNFIDNTADAAQDNDTTDYWDGTIPNITPSAATSEVLVMVTWTYQSTGAANVYISTRIERDATGSNPTCGSDTTVGDEMTSFTTDTGPLASASGIFVDAPGTTNNVRYTLCSDADTDNTNANIQEIHFTLYEINDAADLAEVYSTNDASLTMGELVRLDPGLTVGVRRALGAYSGDVIGVVSTKPAMVIGGTMGEGESGVPVALSGRVPVRVNLENGPIQAGDYLVVSPVPGEAMKATRSGYVIGRAMSAYDGNGENLVLAFVERGYRLIVAEEPGGMPDQPTSQTIVPNGEQDIQQTDTADNLGCGTSYIPVDGGDYAATELQGGALPELFVENLTAGQAVFEGSVKVRGNLYVNQDTAGQAMILAGDTSVDVEFGQTYEYIPIVTATVINSLVDDLDYAVTNITRNGFAIRIDQSYGQNITFSWHALGVNNGKLFVSDGSVRSVTIGVSESPSDAAEGNYTAVYEEPAATENEETVDDSTDEGVADAEVTIEETGESNTTNEPTIDEPADEAGDTGDAMEEPVVSEEPADTGSDETADAPATSEGTDSDSAPTSEAPASSDSSAPAGDSAPPAAEAPASPSPPPADSE